MTPRVNMTVVRRAASRGSEELSADCQWLRDCLRVSSPYAIALGVATFAAVVEPWVGGALNVVFDALYICGGLASAILAPIRAAQLSLRVEYASEWTRRFELMGLAVAAAVLAPVVLVAIPYLAGAQSISGSLGVVLVAPLTVVPGFFGAMLIRE